MNGNSMDDLHQFSHRLPLLCKTIFSLMTKLYTRRAYDSQEFGSILNALLIESSPTDVKGLETLERRTYRFGRLKSPVRIEEHGEPL